MENVTMNNDFFITDARNFPINLLIINIEHEWKM